MTSEVDAELHVGSTIKSMWAFSYSVSYTYFPIYSLFEPIWLLLFPLRDQKMVSADVANFSALRQALAPKLKHNFLSLLLIGLRWQNISAIQKWF